MFIPPGPAHGAQVATEQEVAVLVPDNTPAVQVLTSEEQVDPQGTEVLE